MTLKLRCKIEICRNEHKATAKNFPLMFQSDEDVVKDGKVVGKRKVIVGYACARCVRKYRCSELIKQYKVEQEGGETLDQAIHRKVCRTKIKEKHQDKIKKPADQQKPKRGLFNRAKDFAKRMIQKKRGR